MRIAVGTDHAGFPLKDAVIDELHKLNVEVVDKGGWDTTPSDFPDFARPSGARHTEWRGGSRYPPLWQWRWRLYRRQQAPRRPGSPDARHLQRPPGRGARRHERHVPGVAYHRRSARP